MNRRTFLTAGGASLLSVLGGCKYLSYLRVDPDHFLIRSPYIHSVEQEREILSRARLERTADRRVRVLYTQGTPYEIGYQHGALLRDEVQQNIGYLYKRAVSTLRSEEILSEAYERMRPWIPREYIDEMHGLAHGARLPLHVVHNIHILPDVGEWGGKKRIKKIINEMRAGLYATTCSNVALDGPASKDGSLYAVRILDWGLHRVSRLHEFPLIHVSRPQNGVPYANLGWVGFIGAVSGLNAEGITLGEMGYRDPEGETLDGIPMTLMLRDVLSNARNLADVRRIIATARGTNSYVFLMTDGKTGESELYVKDRNRFLTFGPNTEVNDGKEHLPAIENMVYGGHYNEKMTDLLSRHRGELTPELFMNDIIPQIAMKSNFQNVIYKPRDLAVWVSNAASKDEWAASQPYTYFDFRAALESYPAVAGSTVAGAGRAPEPVKAASSASEARHTR